jgi:ABC-type Fe3+/spermidine/putrescine transport system ATPase subunit
VTFGYGGAPILRRATLVLPRTGCVCLSGPSGCGKTTALHLLAGLLTPQEGVVDVPKRLSMVFQ